MNGDVLIQNVINIFIISIILEAAVMAVFSMSALRDLESSRPIEATRDAIIIIVAFFLCYKVDILRIFRGTGIAVPRILDVVISALVLTRMSNFIRQLMNRFKKG